MNHFGRTIGFLLLCLTVSVCLARESWRDGTYSKVLADGQPIDIRQLFRDFADSRNIPVIVDPVIEGQVVIQYPELTPVEYLDRLARENGLIWFERGGVIYVYDNSQLESRVFQLNAVDLKRLIEVMKNFGIYSEKFPLKVEPELGIVYAVGPTAYLDELENIARDIEVAIRRSASIDVKVEVIKLKYASADDQFFRVGQQEIVVPGLATILNSVIGQQAGQFAAQTRGPTRILNNRPGLRGAGLIAPFNQLLATTQQAAINSQVAAAQAEAQFEAAAAAQAQIEQAIAAQNAQGGSAEARAQQQLAAQVSTIIQPDSRLNAIIIRDVADRIEKYKELIAQLDQPVSQVQIKVSIIDVDASHSLQLGPPYNVQFNNDGTQRNIIGRLDTDNLTSLATSPTVGNLTFQLADGAVNQLLFNIQALENDDHARLIAKPAVVVLDHQSAFLEESEEFFVEVAGNEQVDLFNVIVGTKLTITPHIVDDFGGRRIKLTVDIEDGTRSAVDTVDSIPVVSRNTVNTQTLLMEGESLLIGGLMREQETKDVRAVPVLGRLPKVGFMFRETVHSTARLERLILIKPTIIDLPTYGSYEERPLIEADPMNMPLPELNNTIAPDSEAGPVLVPNGTRQAPGNNQQTGSPTLSPEDFQATTAPGNRTPPAPQTETPPVVFPPTLKQQPPEQPTPPARPPSIAPNTSESSTTRQGNQFKQTQLSHFSDSQPQFDTKEPIREVEQFSPRMQPPATTHLSVSKNDSQDLDQIWGHTNDAANQAVPGWNTAKQPHRFSTVQPLFEPDAAEPETRLFPSQPLRSQPLRSQPLHNPPSPQTIQKSAPRVETVAGNRVDPTRATVRPAHHQAEVTLGTPVRIPPDNTPKLRPNSTEWRPSSRNQNPPQQTLPPHPNMATLSKPDAQASGSRQVDQSGRANISLSQPNELPETTNIDPSRNWLNHNRYLEHDTSRLLDIPIGIQPQQTPLPPIQLLDNASMLRQQFYETPAD